jgi:isopentenyl-diphosphate delta-isomerase
MSHNNVILVNEFDDEIGVMEKLEAHQKGLLHRAFSIFVFNDKNEMLLQKRALTKYHSGGLWTNTCCSHPSENESILEAGIRRLKEEMNYQADLHPSFSFIYKVALDNDLTEHELDHVLIGRSNSNPILNPEEASDYKWVAIDQVSKDVLENKNNYTHWFYLIMTNYSIELIKSLNKI